MMLYTASGISSSGKSTMEDDALSSGSEAFQAKLLKRCAASRLYRARWPNSGGTDQINLDWLCGTGR
jgi:hypothetical protein